MLRLLSGLIIAAFAFAADPYADTVQPVLRRYCIGCHSTQSASGGFQLDALLKDPNLLKQRDQWEQIARRIRSGEMPPPSAPKPLAAQGQSIVQWIETAYDKLDRTQPQDPGRVTARRLSRYEYSNSVRDLLGFDMQPSEALPPDPYGYGFDNIGDVLSMNSALTELYLKAAERIAQSAIPIDEQPEPPVMKRYLAERIGQDRQLHLRIDHSFPADGEYMLRSAFYQGLRDGTEAQMRLFLDGKEVASDVLHIHYQIDRAVQAPGIKVTAGRHRIDATIQMITDRYKGAQPYLEYVQVYGPLKSTPAGQSSAYKHFFTCGHAPGTHNATCARKLLEPLARKAWRRPIAPSELDGLLSLAHREQARTKSFEQAMLTSLAAILVSPHFLFRIERDRGTGSQPLSQHELANRLSYFFWSTLPDDALSALANQGKLTQSLRELARRMLDNSKSNALVENFAGQWLQLRNLDTAKPDPIRFPTFTGELATDMRTETEMLFAAMLKEDRPIPDLLDANFTFLNERLATHYGIAGITGHEFRRVALDGAQRGGLLAHASVLTVSSYPTRTSPVIRGKWILENILNQPPPPPPPNIPALDEKQSDSTGTMRQQLEKHRASAACAGCHSRMDPLGFGLENYDAIGRWRTQDGNAPIDASGVLPNGAKFSTPSELRAILKADKDIFTLALTEKLLIYATGRGMEISDRAAIRKIAARVKDNGYKFRELIFGIVESDPFLMRGAAVQSKDKPQ